MSVAIEPAVLPVIPESFRERPYARAHYARIAAWAAARHPFYARRARAGAVDFPVITRSDVQDDNALLLNGAKVTGRTSGSTSQPVEVSWSPERSRMDRDDTAQFVRWLGGPLPNMRIIALSAHAKNERTIDVIDPLPEQVEFIQRRHRADGACSLVTYPSNLGMLAQHVLEQGIDMSFVRRIVCLSEVYEDWHDEVARKAFPNALVSCTYSSVELGLIAGRCPHRPQNYHIMAHKLGVEFLDEEGRPCREGEPGQVVVTDYWNRRSPFIRYALGDFAAPTTCDCGRIPLPALTNVIGKVRGVLKDRSGRPMMFTNLSPMFRDSPEVRQFQLVQPALQRFVVRLVPRAGAALEPFFGRVRERFRAEFGADAEVEFQLETEIPRSAGGKFHGSICLA